VHRGTPFRQAHSIVGKIVRDSIAKNVPMVDIVSGHDSFGPDAVSLFNPGVSVERRQSPGASGPLASQEQRARLTEAIRKAEERLA
jgi:argininosuccinate lyase